MCFSEMHRWMAIAYSANLLILAIRQMSSFNSIKTRALHKRSHGYPYSVCVVRVGLGQILIHSYSTYKPWNCEIYLRIRWTIQRSATVKTAILVSVDGTNQSAIAKYGME